MKGKTTWFFGYGSLIWRPYTPHLRSTPATIQGWERRFWQGSPDHRGTPDQPGRVVTLVPSPGASCVGVCFEVGADGLEAALAKLDHREKAGYERVEIQATTPSGETIENAIMYIAQAGNPDFLGDASLDEMALQIIQAKGPSGRNLDYVLSLHESLLALGVDDAHVTALAERLKQQTDVPW